MSKQTINIGASPNDGTGTPLRTSFDYTNQNFTELYTALGGGVGLPGATTQVIFNDGGTNLAGDAGLVYNKTTDALTVAGLVTAGSATITGDLTVRTNKLKVTSIGVGAGTTTPAAILHSTQTSSYDALILDSDSASTYCTQNWRINGVQKAQAFLDYADDSFLIRTNTATGPLKFGCNNILQHRIDPLGVFTWYDGAGGTRMTLNSTGLLIGGSTNTTSAKLVAQAGTSNAVQYSMIELRGGSSSGSNQLGLIRRQTTAAVSNSAVTIYGTCTYGELMVVTGTGSGAIFADLLMVSYNTVSVISSNTQQGSPAARTYSISTGNLQLTMGSATSMAITSQAFTAGGLGL